MPLGNQRSNNYLIPLDTQQAAPVNAGAFIVPQNTAIDGIIFALSTGAIGHVMIYFGFEVQGFPVKDGQSYDWSDTAPEDRGFGIATDQALAGEFLIIQVWFHDTACPAAPEFSHV